MNGIVVSVLGLIGVVVTATVGYFVARRTASGSIDSTEAHTLWEQSNFLLERYKADLEATRAEITRLDAEVIALRLRVHELEVEATQVAAVRLAVAAAEALAQPPTGTPADVKARAEALEVARTLAAEVRVGLEAREAREAKGGGDD